MTALLAKARERHPPIGNPRSANRRERTGSAAICLRGAVLVAFAFGAGCQSPPVSPGPPARPSVVLDVRHALPPSVTARTLETTLDRGAPAAWQVTVDFLALDDRLAESLEPLLTRARLVSSTSGGRPVLPTSELASGSVVGGITDGESFLARLEQGDRAVRIGEVRGALPGGVEASLFLQGRVARRDPVYGDLSRRAVVRVQRGAEPAPETGAEVITFTLTIEEVATGSEVRQLQAPESIIQQESVVLETVNVTERHGLAMVFPSPFRGGARRLAALARIAPAPTPQSEKSIQEAHDVAFTHCVEALDRGAKSPPSPGPVSPVGNEATTMDPDAAASALKALNLAAARRKALLYLAESSGAPLAADLALAADNETLAEIARLALRRAGPAVRATDVPALGWTLERSGYLALVSAMTRDALPVGLRSVLVTHAGELGRHALALQELVTACDDLASLRRRLIEENWIYLQDTSAASRVRAFRWLENRRRAPEGYDPLAPAAERREALLSALPPSATTLARPGGAADPTSAEGEKP